MEPWLIQLLIQFPIVGIVAGLVGYAIRYTNGVYAGFLDRQEKLTAKFDAALDKLKASFDAAADRSDEKHGRALAELRAAQDKAIREKNKEIRELFDLLRQVTERKAGGP